MSVLGIKEKTRAQPARAAATNNPLMTGRHTEAYTACRETRCTDRGATVDLGDMCRQVAVFHWNHALSYEVKCTLIWNCLRSFLLLNQRVEVVIDTQEVA